MRIESDEDPRSAGLFPGREGSASATPPEPIIHAGYATLSLRQIDEWNGVPKGTAFRLFKAQKDQLREGQDFFYIPEGKDPELTETLRMDGRIYPSTVHLLLMTTTACARMREEWHRRIHKTGCGCPEEH
ncbi:MULTISPECIES: hypothetical protein [unclassified Thioalkalivibrio]|uniref:hypothetical protein n=1 Tax=unclassified Thioalkalivibrio TaxID=2621013 RepID=UPI00036A35DD|nr:MULTISPECIES: hypothetical protein [unclassified Thioalkalivibrio]